MKLPLVSVLCPTYNRPRMLNRAVQQFLAYRYGGGREMIIVDDSPERAEIIKHPSVKYIKLPSRMILGEKHNFAARLAQGEIIVHQDDDDIYSTRRLAKQLEPIALGQADITGFSVNYVLDGPKSEFFRFKPGIRFNIANEPDAKVLFAFHDATSAYHHKVWDNGVRYPAWAGGEKLAFVNHAIEAGFRHAPVENKDLFVYVRHGHNTWNYRDHLIHQPTTRPTWISDETLEFYKRGAS